MNCKVTEEEFGILNVLIEHFHLAFRLAHQYDLVKLILMEPCLIVYVVDVNVYVMNQELLSMMHLNFDDELMLNLHAKDNETKVIRQK